MSAGNKVTLGQRSPARPLAVACALLFCTCAGTAFCEPIWQRTVTDYIGHDWTAEMVHFAVESDAQLDPAKCRLVMTDEQGAQTELAFQLERMTRDEAAGKWRGDLYCVLDVPAFGSRRLALEAGEPAGNLARSMAVERDEKAIRIDSGALQIEVPASAAPGTPEEKAPTPLLRMQNVKAGRWIGRGRFSGVGALKGLNVNVKPGAVFSDAQLDYEFEKGTYSARLRLIRGQPEVLWKESFQIDGDGLLVWDCAPGFGPRTGLWQYYRTAYPYRKTNMGTPKRYPLQFNDAPEVTTFTPWVHWWSDDITTWMEMWDDADEWAVGIFTGDPLEWNPADRAAYQAAFFRLKITKDKQALLELPLRKGVRTFGLSLAPRTLDPRIGVNVTDGPTDTAARQIKYAEMPLDEVKDYILTYDGDPPDSYPKFVCTPEQRGELREALKQDFPFLKSVQNAVAWAAGAKPLADADDIWRLNIAPGPQKWPNTVDRATLVRAAALRAEGDYQTHVRLAAHRDSLMSVNYLLRHGTGPAMSVAPHNWMTSGPVDYLNPLVDVATPMLTPKELQAVRARMLFFAYQLASDRFWSPRLGFGGTANMTTMIYTELAFISFLYPNHPLAQQWRKTALDEIYHELDHWAGEKGGWLEAPHYATVSLDHIAAVGYAMQNMKLEGPLYHPGLKNAVEWLAKISSPPDARFNNRRCFAPLGNTYIYETSYLYGCMAKAYRERDPQYANAMRWIWKEHGYPMHPGIGGAYPTSDGLRELMVDTTPPAGPPDWGSEDFPGSGAIMRSGFPTDRETQLYVIQGRLHEHYDRDEGSFQLWGKGRPLSLDWGYHGCDDAAHHNRVDLGGVGRIEPFVAQPPADYLHNIQQHWDRQMVFVKDADPLGPNYFVVLDTVAANAPRAGNWWLWLYTPQEPAREGATVRMKGMDDVDMDVWFAPSASALLDAQKGGAHGIKTEELTLTIHSGGPKPPTQRGMKLSLNAGARLLWVMYPRLNAEKPPTVTALAGDKGVKVESAAGTDYVFVSLEPCEFKEGTTSFKGKAGIIKVRGKKVSLTLMEAGEIAYEGNTLASEKPASKTFTR